MRTFPYLPLAAAAQRAQIIVFASLIAACATVSLPAQTVPDKPADDETIVLNPFVVSSSSDVGYTATETLSGGRLKSELKDVATQVNVMTPEFLEDLAITSLDEAMQYSLNTEQQVDTQDVSAPGNLGIGDTTLGLNNGYGRTRSLGTPNKGHDFFDTNLRIDAYNTERFTFSSGPNSVLFGNAQAAGTIDTTFKRAKLARPRYEVSYRIDSNGSERITTDLNQPIIKNKLAVRITGLRERQEDWREPSSYDQDRLYGSLTYQPIKKISLHAYYEKIRVHSIPVRNTLLQDHVTPWVNAGSPTYNNGGTGTLPSTSNTPFALGGAANLVYVINSPQSIPVTSSENTAGTDAFDTNTPAPDNFEHSIIDDSLYARDLNFSGNANQSRLSGWIRGAILEVNPLPHFFIEAGINQEKGRHRGNDFFDNSVAELQVDANLYLNDRVTPNPNYGRYFFEDDAPITRKNYSYKVQKRLAFSYDLDFTQRTGWTRWLGDHRLAALFDQLDSISYSMQSSYRVVDNTGRRTLMRYYVSPDHPTIDLPFDPLADGPIPLPGALDTSGNPVSIAAWDPSTPPDGAWTQTRGVQSSRTLSMQNRLLQNRAIFSFAQRVDNVELFQAPTLASGYDFDSIIAGPIPWESVKTNAPVTRLKSLVVHPFKWLSASYVESDSQQVNSSIRRNLDGTIPDQGAGLGKEYGITLRLNDKLSLRIGKYENTGVGNNSTTRGPNPVATIQGTRGNQLRRDLANLERTVMLAGAPRSEKYGYYEDYLADAIPTGANAGAVIQNTFDMFSDRVSKGYELTLIGNPTPNWRVSISAAKSESVESNIAPQYFDFIAERIPVWSNYLNTKFLPSTNKPGGTLTVGDVLAAEVNNLNYIRLSEGHLNTLERKYRFTATTRYSFHEGFLKGSYAGANYLWRSPAAAGYRKTTITDNPFVIPGLNITSTVDVDDLANPVYGSPTTSFDAFFGYQHRLFKNRIMWRAQLNIRNVFDKEVLLMQRSLSDGTGAIYTAQAPRSFILTNTFSF